MIITSDASVQHCEFDSVVVAAQLRATVRDIDASRWQECLSLWNKLQRTANRPCCSVQCSPSDDNSKNSSQTDLHKLVEDVGRPRSTVKRKSVDLVTFRVSAKCAGRTSSFNSQVVTYIFFPVATNGYK